MKSVFITLFLTGTCVATIAQEKANHTFHPHHTLGIVVSHTQVSQGIQNGDRKWLALPSWGINYNYKFSPKWAIGLHNDIIVESFTVTNHLKSGAGSEELERSYPIASAIVASYKPGKHFSFLMGSGGEFSHTGNLFLIRIGLEYGYHMNNKWELNANIVNDLRWNAYNSFAIGLGVTRIL
jgi:hypothetical protein